MIPLTKLMAKVKTVLARTRRLERILEGADFDKTWEKLSEYDKLFLLECTDVAKIENAISMLKMSDMQNWTLNKLRAAAKLYGVPKYWVQTKQQLIKEIYNAQKATAIESESEETNQPYFG